MNQGRIYAARHGGVYMIKLVGDVRLSLCITLDDYLDRLFDDPALRDVLIDLGAATGIDSTSLGLLAKLGLQFQRRFAVPAVVYSGNPGINRLLHSMAFDKIFTIREPHCADTASAPECDELPAVSGETEVVRRKVIEAHQILMDMSEENHERFEDLMVTLER